jgi:hypothetical protein
MNTQIKELAEQCGSTHKQSLGVYQFYTEELEKFAESIVEECAKIARENNLEKANRSYLVHRAIKEHFGLET